MRYNLAIIFPSICQKKLKTCAHTKTCTHIFMVVLFIFVKTYNGHRYQEWTNCSDPHNGILISNKMKWAIKPQLYIYVNKCKNDTCLDCSRNWEREDERQQQRGWIQVWYLVHCKNFCKYPNVLSQHNSNK
jgi:hypothetical protein